MNRKLYRLSLRLLHPPAWALVVAAQLLNAPIHAGVSAVPAEVRQDWRLDEFYQKYLAAGPLPIVSSTNTSDYALLETHYLLRNLLKDRPDILEVLAKRHAKVVVMAYNEYTTDLPEQRDMKPKAYWDSRARGLGGRTCSCAEENILCFPGDPYSTENIFIHEFAHVIQGVALNALDPTFSDRLQSAFTNAMAKGLWRGTYAASDAGEYWAEAVQDWFDNNRANDALHNHVHTRVQLMEYDPALAQLCLEVFGDGPWRYRKPMDRPAAERAHLAGYDFGSSPRFHWRKAPMVAKPRVQIETSLGDIEVELYFDRAPTTVSNYLHYVEERLYNDGEFFRAVTLENQPTNEVKIQVVQAEANRSKEKEFLPAIPLERTRDTGLRHLDGTLSMARNGPDTAQASFFVCVGDQPELDFGGRRNPDGQGFAAFGRVVKGMEVVRQMQRGAKESQTLHPPVPIQRAVRLE